MAIQDIPLSQAPEHFFDKELWTFLSKNKDRRAALSFIDNRHGFLIAGTPNAEAGTKIYEKFISLLVNGEIVATGIPAISTDRTLIPVGLWKSLRPEFLKGEAKSADHKFLDVRLSVEQPSASSNLRERLVDWMKNRHRANPDEFKKTLYDAVPEEFKPLGVRGWDSVYAEVYQRKRGHPRKTKK